jgi:serine phosphatase RsbU (regulator of sigma subunit)
VPSLLGAAGAASLVADEEGVLTARAVADLPMSIVEAIEQHGGVAGYGAATVDGPFVIPELGAESLVAAGVRAAANTAGAASWALVGVPFTARDQTVGLLVVVFDRELPESLDDSLELLAAFGRHVGNALLNAREFERERRTRQRVERSLELEREGARQVRALHEVSRTFATSLSFEETMRAVVESMTQRLDVDAVWIRTPDERGTSMVLRAFNATSAAMADALERIINLPESRNDALTAHVMSSRRPVLIHGDDPTAWADSELRDRLAPFLRRGTSVAVLPVAIPTEVLGTVTMLSVDPEHALDEERTTIAEGVVTQAALALDNARLYQQQKSFAEVIQESLLPNRLPQIESLDLGVLYRPATVGGAEAPQIGGDFYDFVELPDGRLAFVVGDVTGKGVGAAADTAMTKYIFRALSREHPDPASFLKNANDVVCDEISPGKFVTLFYGVVDPEAGTLTCGNAGHPEPKLVIPPDVEGGEVRLESLGMEGLALGIMSGQDYEQRTYDFPPGATVTVYTDGVVEARRDGRLYGQYRLEKRLTEEAGAGAPQVAFAVFQDCSAWARADLGDDIAIVVIQHVLSAGQ